MSWDEDIIWGDIKHANEFNYLVPKAKQVALMAAYLSKICFGEKLTTSSIFRKKTTDSGIHETYRAIDFKAHSNIAWTYRLIEIINSIYTYDPSRHLLKVAHENPFHGSGVHLHLQVHDNTCVVTPENNLRLLSKSTHDKENFKPIEV